MSAPATQIIHSLDHQHSHTTPCDGVLLGRFIQHKDDNAFSIVMARHGRMVYGIARRLLKNLADADDVCQAAFLVLARKAPQLQSQRSVAGWLVGVVRKLAADVRKMQERRIRHEQKSATPLIISHDASLLASNKEIGQQIDEALAKLPLVSRTAFALLLGRIDQA